MQKKYVDCGAYKGLSDNFHESHNLYSANGKFMKIASNLVMSIKKITKIHGEHLWDHSE